jgi:alpha-galactosidase
MNRRTFCSHLVASSTAAVALGGSARAGSQSVSHAGPPEAGARVPAPQAAPASILRPPDVVTVFLEKDRSVSLTQSSSGTWQAPGIEVGTTLKSGKLAVTLASAAEVFRVRLRWHVGLDHVKLFLGDHWERSYADLEWRGEVPNRTMPWYFLATTGERTDGYGVETGPQAFCFWNADRAGISLWADVRSGGVGVQLGSRVLPVCTVRFRPGVPGESPFAAARELCRAMCARPRLPASPLFGTNDWYYHYGDSRPERILDTTRLVVSVSPKGPHRPWSVVDDGWSPGGDQAGTWDRGNERFGSMADFAGSLAAVGARPGIWFRPLLAAAGRSDSLRLARSRKYLDPSLPAVLEVVRQDTRRFREWGYDLIKHDYSTFDILGRWGFAMGPTLTDDGWAFADRSRTTAEIVLALYQALRDAAGDAVLIGCNTFSHLSAGVFEVNRVGDDTSGRSWDRTRRMGVNTLAFRAPQHGTFYAADPDIAAITKQHPWAQGRLWLRLLGESGMPVFVSPEIEAVTDEARAALGEAFAAAAAGPPVAEPIDWLDTVCPRRWRLHGREMQFDWSSPEGPWPFSD